MARHARHGFGPGGMGPGGRGPGGPMGPAGTMDWVFGPDGPIAMAGQMGQGPWGPGGRRRGRRERGDVRAAILLLLAEKPRHGYEIITEIGDRSEGAWQPSPGSIYPVLKRLAREGLLESSEDEGSRFFRDGQRGVGEVDPIRERGGLHRLILPRAGVQASSALRPSALVRPKPEA